MSIKNSVLLTNSGLRSSIILTFSIAAYPVWFRCMFYDATVDLLFGTAYVLKRKVYNNGDITFLSVY